MNPSTRKAALYAIAAIAIAPALTDFRGLRSARDKPEMLMS